MATASPRRWVMGNCTWNAAVAFAQDGEHSNLNLKEAAGFKMKSSESPLDGSRTQVLATATSGAAPGLLRQEFTGFENGPS